MSLLGLAKRSLGFYWRTNLGVLLAVLVSTAVLSGALVVGDSVRHSLKMTAVARLGRTEVALVQQNGFFRTELADELAAELDTTVAPVLQLRGRVADSNESRWENRVEIYGVDERFFKVGAEEKEGAFWEDWRQGVVLNEPLAARLRVGVGEKIGLRIENPGLMPREVPLAPDSDLSIFLRAEVRAIAGKSEFGRFSLQANQIAPLNVYLPIKWLGENLDRSSQANMLLVSGNPQDSITVEKANEAIRKHWQLADAELELRRLDWQDVFELRSRRILMDEALAAAAMQAGGEAVGILTYFVNELRLGEKTTPYSMVTAMGRPAEGNSIIPSDMQDDEILVNRWLADDLGAKVGDSIELTYYVLSTMRTFVEQKSSFQIREILPMDKPAVDPNLMPDFPGLADSNNCRDWDPGIDIDLNKIHDEDEVYWDDYRGTPKAFVTLEAGQKLWSNRYGNMTAVRYPRSGQAVQDIAGKLLDEVEPASVGLFFQSVRARGMNAGNSTTDFGQLFLGLSMFLIIAAVILTGILFVFGVESRSRQVGMLLAVGFRPRLVRRLLFLEGGLVAVLGAIAGTAAGLLYTKVMIYLLMIAVSGSDIQFYAKPSTLAVGALAGVGVSLFAIWLTLRKQASRPARELLAQGLEWQFFAAGRVSKGRIGLATAAAATIGAIVLLVALGTGDSGAVTGAFFGAGGLLLIAGLGLSQALLKRASSVWNNPMVSLAGLGLRNSTRRSGRSLAVIGLLACGTFLVIAVGANRHDPLSEAHRRDSGTGGFSLFGESAIGILHDLNSKEGRKSLILDDQSLEGVEVVQLRVRDGDDASCFNLNQAQMPRLLGVRPEELKKRGSFGFADAIEDAGGKEAWDLLNLDEGDDVVPAIGDYPTIIWALGKTIGVEGKNELKYRDDKGRSFRLRLVGMLKSSILQGSLLIAEDEFIRRFPSEDGYRVLLIDAPETKADAVSAHLSARLTNFGLAVTSSKQRLAEFGKVENTYLSIFQMLGGLGLILGSVGLGLVVLRNMLERRGELAMLRAVGFDKAALKMMVFYEHAGLALCGLACGVVAALVAVGPALKSPGAQVHYLSLGLTIVAIGISGVVWIWIATTLALRGGMLEALRNE